jgi:hypothetical protein
MATLTESRHPGEFILSVGDAGYSRDRITVAAGSGVLDVGTVLGRITASGKFTASPATGSDGSQTAVAVLYARIDATSADADAVAVVRHAQVNGKQLAYAASVDDGTKRAAKATQLAAVGIIVR